LVRIRSSVTYLTPGSYLVFRTGALNRSAILLPPRWVVETALHVCRQHRILCENVLGKSTTCAVVIRKSLILRLGAGKGNRTLIASLEGWSFTIKLCPRRVLVRVDGFSQISSGNLGLARDGARECALRRASMRAVPRLRGTGSAFVPDASQTLSRPL
jgi:hypothetical protein